MPNLLADWLVYLESLHPKTIVRVGRNNQRALRRMYRSFGAMRYAY
ncbi:MAG: hypothetical protein HY935_00640 [Nitrosomonadales bacterium]|nr:hypothetical protein [Nitrosomonadales bacterium]